MRPTGVLLDVDGTLIDSNDSHAHAWVAALREAGVTVEFLAVRRLIGMGGDKLLPTIASIDAESSEGKAISKRRGEIFLRDHVPHIRAFSEVKQLLTRMKQDGLELAVASSAKKSELEPLIRIAKAEKFIKAKTSSDDAENSKPDPDIVHAALAQLGHPPERVILIGDTPYDVEASLKAGIRVIAFRCGGWTDADLQGAIRVYDDATDLLMNYDKSPFAKSAVDG